MRGLQHTTEGSLLAKRMQLSADGRYAATSFTGALPLQGGGPERTDSKVLSDEEVEEAEASDSFPALGYPAGIGSIGSGEALADH